MDLKRKLRTLLKQYIEESKTIKDEYKRQRINITLYEELLDILKQTHENENNIIIVALLNTIYNNNIYADEFYRILYLPNKEEQMKLFIEKLTSEYNQLKENSKILKQRINRNQLIVPSAHRVLANLKYYTKISNENNDFNNVKRIINYYEILGLISNKEELLLINELESHNRQVGMRYSHSEEEHNYTRNLYAEIPNILTMGFQPHDTIDVHPDRENTINKFSQEIINYIEYVNEEEIVDIIKSYQKYNVEPHEYRYIITKILDNYLEELITLYEYIVKKDTYQNRRERNQAIEDYYEILDQYLIILNYYNQINDTIIEKEESPLEKTLEEQRLIYSRSSLNVEKAKIISDMNSIAEEYYQNIYDLIKLFKEGTLGNNKIKTISYGNNSSGHIELKDDNIRIVLKRVRDNVYNVLGVFIKKANNDRSTYEMIMNRETPNISTNELLTYQLELSKQTEQELENLVDKKGRKNGRK